MNTDGLTEGEEEVQIILGCVGATLKTYEAYPAMKNFVQTCIAMKKAGDFKGLASYMGRNASKVGLKLLPANVQKAIEVIQFTYTHGRSGYTFIKDAVAEGRSAALLGGEASGEAAGASFTTRALKGIKIAQTVATKAGLTVGRVVTSFATKLLSGPVSLALMTADAIAFIAPYVIQYLTDCATFMEDPSRNIPHPVTWNLGGIRGSDMAGVYGTNLKTWSTLMDERIVNGQKDFLDKTFEFLDRDPQNSITQSKLDVIRALLNSIGPANTHAEASAAKIMSWETKLMAYTGALTAYRTAYPDRYDSQGDFWNMDADGRFKEYTEIQKLEHEIQVIRDTGIVDDSTLTAKCKIAMKLFILYVGNENYIKRLNILTSINIIWYQMSATAQTAFNGANPELLSEYNRIKNSPEDKPGDKPNEPTGGDQPKPEDKPADKPTGGDKPKDGGPGGPPGTNDPQNTKRTFDITDSESKPNKEMKYDTHHEAFDVEGGDPFDTGDFVNSGGSDTIRHTDSSTINNIDIDGIFTNLDYNISFDMYANSHAVLRNKF